MNQFTAMLGALKAPLDFLEHFDAQEALDAGLDRSTVKQWETIHNVYLAPTKWARQQRHAAHAARPPRSLILLLSSHVCLRGIA